MTTPLERQLLKALTSLYELHLDATGKKKFDRGEVDIDTWYLRVENQVERAIKQAKKG